MCLFHFPYTLPLLPPSSRPNPLVFLPRVGFPRVQRASGPLKTRITDLNDDGFLTVLVPLLGDGETRWLKRRLFVLDTVFVLRIIFFFFSFFLDERFV